MVRARIFVLFLFPTVVLAQDLTSLMEQRLSNIPERPLYGMSIYMEKQDEAFQEAVGLRREGGENTKATDAFRIASSTKLLVSTIVLQLLEEGKIKTSDNIYSYLKELDFLRLNDFHLWQGKSFTKQITIEQLLSHRSGLADIFNDATRQFFADLMAHPQKSYDVTSIVGLYFHYGLNRAPKFKPGGGWHYSDLNYVLLGLLIEQLDGKPLASAIRHRILTPLKMDNTHFEFYEAEKGTHPRIHQYVEATDFANINTSFDWAGGGLVSTHQDLAVFIKALFNRKLIGNVSLQKMIDVQSTKAQEAPNGFGIYKTSYAGKTFYGHYGFYGTYIGYCQDDDIVLSYCIAQAMPNFQVYDVVDDLVERFLD